MRIRTKLILAFMLSGVIPLLVVFGVSLESIQQGVSAKFTEQIEATGEMTEQLVALYLDGISVRAQDWSTDAHVGATVAEIAALPPEDETALLLSQELGGYLRSRKLALDPSVKVVDIVGLDGRTIASTEPSRVGYAEEPVQLERDYGWGLALVGTYGQVIQNDLGVLEDDEPGHPTEPTMHFSVPLLDATKSHATGVMVLHVSPDRLFALLTSRLSRMADSSFETYLVNRQGYFASPSRFIEDVPLKAKVDTDPVRRCQEKGEGMSGTWLDYRGVPVLGSSNCEAGRWWTLVTEIDQEEVGAAVASTRARNAWVVLLTALLAGAGGMWLSVVMGKRMGACTSVIRDLAQGKFGARVPASDLKRDEIGQAAVGVNAMAERLDEYFGSLNQLYEAVFRQVPVGIMTVASDGKVASVNGQAASVVGAKAGEDLFASAWCGMSGLEAELRGVLGGKAFAREFAIADGRSFLLTGTPLEGRKAGEALLLLEEVTQQKRLVEEQRSYAARLEEEVAKRTKELEGEKLELERTNAHLVGRELRMVELKKRIGDLEGKSPTEGPQPPLTPET